jgi:hypothetical protein
VRLLGARQEHPAVARRFANGYNNPPDFMDWFLDPIKADEYLAMVQGDAAPAFAH